MGKAGEKDRVQAPVSETAAVKRAARRQGRPQRAQVARLLAVLAGAALALAVAALGGGALMRAFLSDADAAAGGAAESLAGATADGQGDFGAADAPGSVEDSCAEPVVFTPQAGAAESAGITVWGAYTCRFERADAGGWAFVARQVRSGTPRALFELAGEPVGFALRRSVFYVVQNLSADAGTGPQVEVVTCTIADGASPTGYLREDGAAAGLELDGDALRVALAGGGEITVDLPPA